MKFDDLISGGAQVSNFGLSSACVLSYFTAYPPCEPSVKERSEEEKKVSGPSALSVC